MDLGRIFYTAIALEEAAAEAALYLAIDPRCPGATDPNISIAGNPCADPNNALYRGEHSGGNQEVNWDQVVWNIPTTPANMGIPFPDCTNVQGVVNAGIGCEVRIQLDYTYDFLTPGIEAIANGVSGGNGLVLRIQATQIVVFE
jgi:hypothetical protein